LPFIANSPTDSDSISNFVNNVALRNKSTAKQYQSQLLSFEKFAKDYLSNGKADKQNNPSFKSCLLRVPGSINSKYKNKVKIIKKWNGIRAPLTLDLLEEFRIYSIQKKIDQIVQRQKILNELSKNKIKTANYYTWIEHLLTTPIPDFRKLVVDIILAPYLINVRKLSYQESYTIIRNWLDKCNELESLDNYRNFVNYRIPYAIKNAMNKGIGPMSKEKIKTDTTYNDLYQILRQIGALI